MDRLEFAKIQIEKSPEPEAYRRSLVPDFVKIGICCRIQEYVYFSHQGFSYIEIDGKLTHIPHAGKIEIGNRVDIFPFTNIDRATAEDKATVIGDDTKIDHHCHIAHNTQIGKRNIICAGTIVGGSAVIGDDCYIGIGTLIKNKVKIGNKVTIGMGAVVICDIPDGETWVGNPAKKLR